MGQGKHVPWCMCEGQRTLGSQILHSTLLKQVPSYFIIIIIILLVIVCMWKVHLCHHQHLEGKDNSKIQFLLLPRGSQGSNLGYQVWQQIPLLTESSPRPSWFYYCASYSRVAGLRPSQRFCLFFLFCLRKAEITDMCHCICIFLTYVPGIQLRLHAC